MEMYNFNPMEAKKYITDRFRRNRCDIVKALEIDIAEAVSQVIDADEEFVDLMDKERCSYSNTDEIEFINRKTGFSQNFIDILLWYKNCYKMELGMWKYDYEDCIKCGGGPLHFKEIPGEVFGEKLVCQECGFEMILGENGLEEYQIG